MICYMVLVGMFGMCCDMLYGVSGYVCLRGLEGRDPHTRTGCTGTGVRSDRIGDDPIHTIQCHDICCVNL